MSTPTFETILYQVEAGVATVTLNRPDKLNAYNSQMLADLSAAFDVVDADDEVRAVIVTGAGRGFCAGADLSRGDDYFDYAKIKDPIRESGLVNGIYRDGGGRLTLRIFRCLKPVVGAVNGAAVGVGSSMLLPMDFRLASDTARFGFVFSRRGITPEGASGWFLPRLVGVSQALEWCYTGRLFPASEALAGRLVRSVHAPDELLPAAMALAREIADNAAPVSIALTRQLMWRGLTLNHPMEVHRADSRAVMARGAMPDAKEGVASFLEKRSPLYSDKVSTDLPDVWPGWVEPEFE